jgi:hypothetical protein
MQLRDDMKRHLLLASLFSACTALLVVAQTPAMTSEPTVLAELHGVARDPQGLPVAAATVVVHNLSENTDRITASGVDGVFEVTGLKPGRYELTAKKDGAGTAPPTTVELDAAQSLSVDATLSLPVAAIAEELASLKKRIEELEAALRASSAVAAAQPARLPLTASNVGSNAASQVGGKTPIPEPAPPVAAAHVIPKALEAPDPAPAVDNDTPFAFGDFTWLNGSPRNKDVVLDTKFFTPEVRFDTHYMEDFNQPIDHTIVGATESFRSGEVQIEQASVGGDFHWENVRGRVLLMYGLFATTTPRNDASAGVGQWDLRDAYRYVSEAYGGYHFNVNHGLNVDAGIFVSYIGLFSYYNFDNWTYQPSYVSSNTPWFFNGVRVQWFPTNKLKIEPWFINGWQSYAKYNGHPGLGGQLLWMPKEWFKLVANQYGFGQDNLGLPKTERIHTDDSIEVRYYNNPNNGNGVSKMAFSLTGDAGAQYGGGICATCGSTGAKDVFLGWMLYDRTWFHHDLLALTLGGGYMNNPGRYLTLLPPINGADAVSGTPYFTENPGQKAHMWDSTITLQYMPRQYITWWMEAGYRHADVPYFAGRGGVTPPGGNNGAPQYYTCTSGATAGTANLAGAQAACGGAGNVWFPDLRHSETKLSVGVMVKF